MKLYAKEISKSYRGREVVKNVSIDVDKGEVVGLLGPNGAGKTTSFHIIVGLIRPDKGEILLGSRNISEMAMHKRARKGISYLPQEPSVFRKLTVEENILAVLEVQELTEGERREKTAALLEDLGISHVMSNKGHSLSGGERRKVEIGRAIVNNPHFLLLDEPFAGIDPIAVADLQKIILKLKQRGIGILITDHNVRETLTICDRAYILNHGDILDSGPPVALMGNRRVRETYLGEGFRI